MCGGNSAINMGLSALGIGNSGSGINNNASGSSDVLNAQLAQEAGQVFQEGQTEYANQAPLRAELIDQATLTPDKIEAARTKSMADVANAYEGATAARERANAAMGINPGDPAAAAGANTSAVQKATAMADQGNKAAIAERQYRTGLASSITGGQTTNIGSAASGLATSASNQAQAAMQASQQQQDRSGLLGFLAKGGTVRGYGLRRAKRRVHMATGGPAASAPAEDAPRYGSLRQTPLMKTPSGEVKSTSAGPAEGHITGPGTETSDSVPAMLAHNEYVNPSFVTSVLGVPVQDTIVEIARKANEGDPEGVMHAKRLMHVVSGYGLNRSPQRVAGKDPAAPRGRGIQAADGGYTPSQQKFADSMHSPSSSYSGPTMKDVGDFANVVGKGVSDAASATGDFLKKHVTSQGAINDIRSSSPALSAKGSARGGIKRGHGLKKRRTVRADDGGVLDTGDAGDWSESQTPGSTSGATSAAPAASGASTASQIAKYVPSVSSKGNVGKQVKSQLTNPANIAKMAVMASA